MRLCHIAVRAISVGMYVESPSSDFYGQLGTLAKLFLAEEYFKRRYTVLLLVSKICTQISNELFQQKTKKEQSRSSTLSASGNSRHEIPSP